MASSRRRPQVGPIEASSLLYLLYQRETETECCRAERISCRLVHDVTLQVKGQLSMNTVIMDYEYSAVFLCLAIHAVYSSMEERVTQTRVRWSWQVIPPLMSCKEWLPKFGCKTTMAVMWHDIIAPSLAQPKSGFVRLWFFSLNIEWKRTGKGCCRDLRSLPFKLLPNLCHTHTLLHSLPFKLLPNLCHTHTLLPSKPTLVTKAVDWDQG